MDDDIYYDITSMLNADNFTLVSAPNVDRLIDEAKSQGKICQEIFKGDELCKALGISIMKHRFPVKNSFIQIYLFLTERFPAEIPTIYLSEDVFKREHFKFIVSNLEEYKKDNKFHIPTILTKVQQQIMKTINQLSIKFVEDFQGLKQMFGPENIFKQFNKMTVSTLLKDTRDPNKQEIAQQFKLSKQYQNAISLFTQITELNDSMLRYLIKRNNELQVQKEKTQQECFRLEKTKLQFSKIFSYYEGLKSRYSKFHITQLMVERIKELTLKVDEYNRKDFSVENFNQYKTLMKQLKKLELKRERMMA